MWDKFCNYNVREIYILAINTWARTWPDAVSFALIF